MIVQRIPELRSYQCKMFVYSSILHMRVWGLIIIIDALQLTANANCQCIVLCYSYCILVYCIALYWRVWQEAEDNQSLNSTAPMTHARTHARTHTHTHTQKKHTNKQTHTRLDVQLCFQHSRWHLISVIAVWQPNGYVARKSCISLNVNGCLQEWTNVYMTVTTPIWFYRTTTFIAVTFSVLAIT